MLWNLRQLYGNNEILWDLTYSPLAMEKEVLTVGSNEQLTQPTGHWWGNHRRSGTLRSGMPGRGQRFLGRWSLPQSYHHHPRGKQLIKRGESECNSEAKQEVIQNKIQIFIYYMTWHQKFGGHLWMGYPILCASCCIKPGQICPKRFCYQYH